MKERYFVQSLLPQWVKINVVADAVVLTILHPFDFQLEWEQKLSDLWDELIDSERESIREIKTPYTEEKVFEFLALLKATKQRRGLVEQVVSFLPDFTEDKPFSHSDEWNVFKSIEGQCEGGKHPVIWSEMLLIKPDQFYLGSNDKEATPYEKPRHKITLQRQILMGKYQVIQALWETVMGENTSHFKGSLRPVENVSWFDCVQFCNKLSDKEGLEKVYKIQGVEVLCDFSCNGYRLPSEAEWEYCARANQEYRFSGSDRCNTVAWYKSNNNDETKVVGQKSPNGFGLYDMSGNVNEFCWDWWKSNYQGFDGRMESGARIDPTGPQNGSKRIFRGGSWSSNETECSVSQRFRINPYKKYINIGFRICRTLD
jgi:formylglycine-generating enzyme